MRRSPTVAAFFLLALGIRPTVLIAQSKDIVLTAKPEAVAHFRQAWAANEVSQQEQALKHLRMSIDADSSFGLARAMYRWSGGATPNDSSDLNRAVADAARGSTVELLLAMAMREGVLSGPANAGALFRAASALAPSDAALASLAFNFETFKDPKDQLVAVKALSARFPDYAPLYNTLAYTGWAAGDRSAALQAAEMQVKLLPKDPNPHDTYAELLQWNGDFPAAALHYREAIKLDPTFVAGLEGLAEIETLQGNYDKARDYIKQLIDGSSTPSLKLFYMRDIAGIYAIQGDRKGMEAQLLAVANGAKAQNDNYAAALMYSMLAASSANGGDAKSAHDYIDLARKTSPGADMRISYYAAMAHGMLKHWAPASEALARAKVAPDPSTAFSPRLAAAEAYLLWAQGKSAEAEALLAKADLTDVLMAGRLADVYAAAGKNAEADKLYQQIASNNALNLYDFPAVNARYRAKQARSAASKKK